MSPWKPLVVLAALALAHDARAQFQPVALDTRGGPASPLPSFIVTAPMRLTLQNGIFPMAGGLQGCATHEEASGNSVGGIPLAFHQTLAVTPRLFLAAFSQLGCPIDGHAGGVLAFVTPIRSFLSLVVSGGIIVAPAQVPLYGNLQNAIKQQMSGNPSPTGGALRADLVWKTTSGRVFTVGIGSTGARHSLTFGGGF